MLPIVAIAGRLGFNREKLEATFVGRLVKGAGALVLWALAVLKGLQEIGWLEDLLRLVRAAIVRDAA